MLPALLAAAALLVLGLCAFPLDLPVSAALMEHPPIAAKAIESPVSLPHLPGDLRRFLDLCEVFAHGLGVALIGVVILVLDPEGRRWLPRILCCAYGGGLVAIAIKLAIARIRPMDFPFAGDVWTTFAAVRPWFDHTAAWMAQGVSGRGLEGFPSGHAATAAGLAAALAWRYPQGTWLFAALGVLAGLQRVTAGAHFLSDALIGAAIGLAFATCCLQAGGLGWGWTKLEMALASRATQ